jgi:pyrimidine-nucleoside phosphorylase
MRAIDIIQKKRDRQELTQSEIEFFIQGYTNGDIPDYQAAAWAMAVLLNGMTDREMADFTMGLVHSGDTLDLTSVVPNAVDKHSTGGVGDKTSLVVEPVVAACGLPVSKMSGRGLGFTGGTLDKIESVPGFRTDLSTEEFMAQLGSIGLVLSGQTAELAPADGKLYALRDVTGTVESIPLIAASIMSKKIAGGAQAIVLDVKVGKGAFMHSLEDASRLACKMVSIASLAGRKSVALLANTDQPLGQAVGNVLEVREAIDTLHGGGPGEFRSHCLQVSAHMLALGGVSDDLANGVSLAESALQSGRAWEKFRDLVIAQDGDVRFVDEPDRLPRAEIIETVPSPRSGYLEGVHARIVGETSVLLGAGRVRKGDPIDHAVGIVVHHKVGARVEAGEPLFTLHANSADHLEEARENLLSAHTWSDEPVDPLPQFHGVIMESDGDIRI